MYQPKESVPHPEGEMNGVVHHALAFNTLLSSQETDAYTFGQPVIRPDIRGVRFVLLCSFVVPVILSDSLFPVKPARFQPVDSILLVCVEFGPPRFQGNPSNLPALERLCEPSFESVGLKGSSENTNAAILRSPL